MSDLCTHTHSLSVHCCANVYIQVRKRLRVYNDMSWDLSQTRASDARERREGKKHRAREKDGMMDETYHAICFLKKDSFFLPVPPPLFEVAIHSSVQ